ncbi:MAG: sporulation protein YqfD [Clostridia bacterium]|nr:sporulation protein YqfD [Clostridia bacterium]
MRIWKFPIGYVKIEVICKRSERFINEALSCGVSLHNIERLSSRIFRALVISTQYEDVLELAGELGAEIRLLRQGGASVLIGELLSRKALVLALTAAIAAMLLLSRRILFINVDCAEQDSNGAIRFLLSSEGIVCGVASSSVDKAELARRISASVESIDYANVLVDGVVLSVEAHSGSFGQSDDIIRPASIHADKDCVILGVAVFDGIAVVRSGDAVRRDQLLVNGDITPEQSPERKLVHAEAEIIGEVAYGFNVHVEPSDLCPTLSGQTSAYVSCELFGLSLDQKPAFADNEIEYYESFPLDACFLPAIARGGIARELVLKQRMLSRREMLETAEAKLQKAMQSEIPESAVIVSKATELVWGDDGSLTARLAVHTYEKIGYMRDI